MDDDEKLLLHISSSDHVTVPLIIDICESCGNKLNNNDFEKICVHCGRVHEIDTSSSISSTDVLYSINTRTVMVGTDSSKYQRDLDGSTTSHYPITQYINIYNEYQSYNNQYSDKNKGNRFNNRILQIAADYYHQLQKKYVKRNNQKRYIMAACLSHAFLSVDIAMTDSFIADFMQLPKKGFSNGQDFLTVAADEGVINFLKESDTYMAHINFAFMRLGLIDLENIDQSFKQKYFRQLRHVVKCVVKVADAHKIGLRSMIKTRILGATCEVLKRVSVKVCPKITIQFISDRCGTKKNTLTNYTKTLIKRNTDIFNLIYAEALFE